MAFLEMHRSQLPADRVTLDVARDLLRVTRAWVEADARHATRSPPDLERRLVRTLKGHLLVPLSDHEIRLSFRTGRCDLRSCPDTEGTSGWIHPVMVPSRSHGLSDLQTSART